MENGYTDIGLIERYLDGSLDDEGMQYVKERISADPAFNAIYRRERFIEKGIRYSFLKTKLEQIKSMEHGLDVAAGKDSRSRPLFLTYWRPLAAAASLLLMAAVYFFLIRPGDTPLNERLFTAYYEPFDSPGAGTTRGNDNSVLTWKQKGYQAYDNARYEEAIPLFQKALKENDDPVVRICLGNAYLSLGRVGQAEEMFLDVLKDHDDLVTQAKWYLALSYLQQGKLERTRATLWEISKSSTYGEKARRLLKELD